MYGMSPKWGIVRQTLGQAVAEVIKDNSGLKCPYGCKGCAWRVFGLVSHLIDKHGFVEDEAWKIAEKMAF